MLILEQGSHRVEKHLRTIDKSRMTLETIELFYFSRLILHNDGYLIS